MTRSMITTNKDAFDNIKSFVKKYINESFQQVIYIETGEQDKYWLQNASTTAEGSFGNKLNIKKALNKLFVTELFLDEKRYIVLKGNVDIEFDSEILEYVEVNNGISTILIAGGFISPKNNPETASFLYDNVVYFEDNSYRAINYNEIETYFNDYCILEVKLDSIANNKLEQILSYITLTDQKDKISNDSLLTEFNSIAIDGNQSIPYDLINQGLMHLDNLKVIYLELYRCIERLFAIPTINKLKEKLNLTQGDWEIIKHLEETTGWRQTEDVGLCNLIKSIPEEDIDRALNFMKSTSLDIDFKQLENDLKIISSLNPDEDKVEMKRRKKELFIKKSSILSSRLYKVRNSFVHYRPIHDDFVKESDLPHLCCCLLNVVNPVYKAIINTQ